MEATVLLPDFARTDSFSLSRQETNACPEANIIGLLRLKGYLISKQKMAFVSGICTLKEIENPEELWLYLKKQNNKISITTVYYNLRLMVKEQVMIKTPNAGRASSYRLSTSIIKN